ncbi:MAG: cell wall hydrolase/autolysin [Pelosinus sp.]|jgi:N-acetylmuramoyl-L-alanine amidase|nr:cell wall hydrolase/autolysin [Pelosinus sp.]
MKKQVIKPLLFIVLLLLLLSLTSTIVSAAYNTQSTGKLSEYLTNQSQQSQKHPLQGKVIVVDPGHGGSDAGAIGPNHVAEKNVTLAIGNDLQKLLSDGGATVIMTRTSDQDVATEAVSDIEELQARVDIANQGNADLFISIHTDAFAEHGTGTTTYFYPGSNDDLARVVQDSMVSQLNLYDRGSQPSDYYVLKHTNMPAILTEAAFISNPNEERLLISRDFNKKVAFGIYNGIKNYFLLQ